MNKNVKSILFFGILLLIADQALKIIITDKFAVGRNFLLIKNLLYFNLVHNEGAAFGLFQGGRIFLIIIAIFAVVLICFMANGDEALTGKSIFAYSLLIGGIMGNMVDRIIHGYVIDYISISIGKFSFPVFNFADICITLSILILIVSTIIGDAFKE